MRSTSLLITDTQQTVLARTQSGACESVRYDPWGARSPTVADGTAMGFNGEPLERGVPLYLLGNGRRAYLPRLRRFSSPDPLAPFGTGQINPYGYVLGDPVNLQDPTGLSPESISAIMSITFHVLIIFGNLAPMAMGRLSGVPIPGLTKLGTFLSLAGSATTITGSTMVLAGHPNARIVSQVGTGLSITGYFAKLPEIGRKVHSAYNVYTENKNLPVLISQRLNESELPGLTSWPTGTSIAQSSSASRIIAPIMETVGLLGDIGLALNTFAESGAGNPSAIAVLANPVNRSSQARSRWPEGEATRIRRHGT